MNNPRSRPLLVLLASGLLGFGLGMFRFPTWQVAVETAQVLAGIVRYPEGNPFYIYHTKLWTVLHQVCAVLLRAGMSEILLSKLVSGVLGMVSFQALSLFVYALSRNPALAIATAPVIFFTGVAERGPAYPVNLMNTADTYGAIGLSTIVLVVALFGAGCYRAGGFLLGLAPAVHPSLGAWLWLVTAIGFVWDSIDGPPTLYAKPETGHYLRRSDEFRPALKYFVAGFAATIASLLVQLLFIYDAPRADAAASARYLSAFIAFWDPHRRPARLLTLAAAVNIGALALAVTWLVAFKDSLSRSVAFLLRVVAVCAVLSLLFVLVPRIPPQNVPGVFLILMPARLLNFNLMLIVALVVGLIAASRPRIWGTWAAAALLAVLVVTHYRTVWDRVRWPSESPDFRDQSNDPFFATVAAERKGLLLTGGSLHLIQLATRRPVLLDGGGLDALPYSLEAAPEMARILRDVYDIDLLNPPIEARGGGATIPDEVNRSVWERYSRQKWQEIGRACHITQVMTYAEWTLDLPLVAHNDWLRLYRIPE